MAMLFLAHGFIDPVGCKVEILLMGIFGVAIMGSGRILPALTIWLVPSRVRATPAFQGIWTGWSGLHAGTIVMAVALSSTTTTATHDCLLQRDASS